MSAPRRQSSPRAPDAALGPPMKLQRKCACGASKPTGEMCEECTGKALQTKLAVGSVADPLEQEADRVADRVMASTAPGTVGPTPASVQRAGGASGTTQAAPESVERTLAGGGRPLDPAVRHEMGHRFGHDFFDVRVHDDAQAQASARDVSAQAYTSGSHIVFATGKYSPGTREGQRLLAHELTHVVQQGAAAWPLVQRDAKPASPNPTDKTAQDIIDAAKDTKATPDSGQRATNAVWSIIKAYYPTEVAKVSAVVYEEKDPGLTTSPVGTGATLTGKITVGKYFVDHIDSLARRVLQVGHELQHIDQQRGGMGGPAKQNEREFLAFAWEALEEPKAGTGRLSYAMRRDMIDCALGHYYCLEAELQKSYEEKKKKLLAKRDEVNGKGGNPATEPPTTCKPCSTGSTGKTGGKQAQGAGPTGKVAMQPPTTKVAAKDATPVEAGEKPEKFSVAAGGEAEFSREGTETKATLSFEASIPVAELLTPDGLRTRPLLQGAPLKFFDEFSLEPSAGFKGDAPQRALLTPLALEASLKMVSIEWKLREDTLTLGLGLEAKAGGEYTPQTRESKLEAGGAAGAELEYKSAKKFFLKVEARGEGKFSKAGDAEFEWSGVSFTVGAKAGRAF
jgi:hypothetical protein